jgi:hypothetical protein
MCTLRTHYVTSNPIARKIEATYHKSYLAPLEGLDFERSKIVLQRSRAISRYIGGIALPSTLE